MCKEQCEVEVLGKLCTTDTDIDSRHRFEDKHRHKHRQRHRQRNRYQHKHRHRHRLSSRQQTPLECLHYVWLSSFFEHGEVNWEKT